MTDDTDPSPSIQGTKPRLKERCPDCGVAVGEPHVFDPVDGGCDVARCLVTGDQRLTCELDHDCGKDIWTGRWPSTVDCEPPDWMFDPSTSDLDDFYE